jgi:hypothetical protein
VATVAHGTTTGYSGLRVKTSNGAVAAQYMTSSDTYKTPGERDRNEIGDGFGFTLPPTATVRQGEKITFIPGALEVAL